MWINQELTEVVVVAAHGLATARVAWDANDADGAAGEPDRDVDALADNAQQAEESGNGRSTGRLDAVAALHRTSGAGRSGRRG